MSVYENILKALKKGKIHMTLIDPATSGPEGSADIAFELFEITFLERSLKLFSDLSDITAWVDVSLLTLIPLIPVAPNPSRKSLGLSIFNIIMVRSRFNTCSGL